MRYVSLLPLWLTMLITTAAAFGTTVGIRGCQIAGRDDQIGAAEKKNADRLSELALYVAAQDVLSPPKDGEAPLTSALRIVRVLEGTSVFAKDGIEAVLEAARRFHKAPVGISIMPADDRLAQLLTLANHPTFEFLAGLSREERSRMDAIMAGKMKAIDGVPRPSRVPPPTEWSLWWPWALAWLTAANLAVWLLALWYWMERRLWFCSGYPWRRVGGVLCAPFLAPGLLPLYAVHGFVLLFMKDWTGVAGRAFRRLFRFGLRIGVIRRLPAPPRPAALPQVALAERAVTEPRPTRLPDTEGDGDEDLDWYVVEPHLILGCAATLAAAGIPVFPVELHAPSRLKGYGVHATRIEAFERLLGLDDVDDELVATDIRRTSLLRYALPGPQVESVGFPRSASPFFVKTLESVSSAARARIRLEYGDERVCRPRSTPGTDRIRFWYAGYPEGADGQRTVPARCFGRDQSGDRLTFFSTDARLGPTVNDADGNAVLQLVNGEIYLLFRGIQEHEAQPWADEALASVLREGIRLARVGRTPEDEARETARWREDHARQREAYVSACRRRIDDRRDVLSGGIVRSEDEIVTAGKVIAKGLADKAKLERELKAFESTLEREVDLLGKEFDQLSASESITGLEWQESGLDVFTKTVFIRHLGTRYRIGRFRIRLGTDGSISLFNLDHHLAPQTHFHHPHVRSHDAPCFGNIHEALNKTMARREFAQVVNLLFRFLENYNPHAGVEDVTHWPEATHADR